jgi:hypothetical protein
MQSGWVVADRLVAVRPDGNKADDDHGNRCQRYYRSNPPTTTAQAKFRQRSRRYIPAQSGDRPTGDIVDRFVFHQLRHRVPLQLVRPDDPRGSVEL